MPVKGKRKVYCFATNDKFELMVSLPMLLKDFCKEYNLDKSYVLYCAGKGQGHRHRGLYKIIGFYEEDENDLRHDGTDRPHRSV